MEKVGNSVCSAYFVTLGSSIINTSSIPNLLLHPQENGCHIHNIEAILKVDIHSESLGNNLQLCFSAIVDQTHRIFSIQLGASTLFWEQNLCSSVLPGAQFLTACAPSWIEPKWVLWQQIWIWEFLEFFSWAFRIYINFYHSSKTLPTRLCAPQCS